MSGPDISFVRDPYWAKPLVSYTVMQLLAPPARNACTGILQQIAAVAGGAGNLLVAPPESFHLSLHAIAPVRSDFDKDAWWAQHGDQARAALRRWCGGQAGSTLRFRELRATSTAVIAMADTDEMVWSLRRTLKVEIPQPPGGTPKYDMIHMTLARYARPEKLPADFAARIAALPLTLDVPLREIVLMRETAYPLLAGAPVETHHLTPEKVS